MVLIMIFIIGIRDDFVVVRIGWIGLLNCKEVLMYLYLVVIMIGWIGFGVVVFFGIRVVIRFIGN